MRVRFPLDLLQNSRIAHRTHGAYATYGAHGAHGTHGLRTLLMVRTLLMLLTDYPQIVHATHGLPTDCSRYSWRLRYLRRSCYSRIAHALENFTKIL